MIPIIIIYIIIIIISLIFIIYSILNKSLPINISNTLTFLGYYDDAVLKSKYKYIPIPTDLSNIKSISISQFHSLAIKTNGEVIGWGYNIDEILNYPKTTTNKEVSISNYMSLILTNEGKVITFGTNNTLLSNNTLLNNNISKFTNNIEKISLGNSHLLFLDKNKNVFGIGINYGINYYNLPDNYYTNIKKIAASGIISLALKYDGSIITWGNDKLYLNIPDGTLINRGDLFISTSTTNDFSDIACYDTISAAIKNGSVVAWGIMDNSLKTDLNTSLLNNNIKSISVGYQFIAALKNNNTAIIFGTGDYDPAISNAKIVLKDVTNIKQLFAGHNKVAYIK